ncbi:MAG: hypothetical protein HOH43_00435 [Candidatus Latescibacteria bacterium]|jgi:hypothetical protein|nr:hypothetical protein [Candidatus Latescibacterota bacterium]
MARPIKLRTVLIGLVFSVFVSLWGQYASAQTSYNYITFPQMPLCLILPYILLVIAPNLIVRKIVQSWALETSELIVIFCMGLISATVPDWGMVRYLISLIVAPDYYASPENQWQELFFEFLPRWLVVPNDNGAVSYFFAGLPSGESIPWMAWVTPLFWWFTALGTLLFVGACLVVIMRRQWVEHERLRFPMGEVILRLVENDESGSRLPKLYRNRTFHTGFAITFAIMVWNCIAYWDVLPRIPIPNPPTSLVFDPVFPAISLRLVPYALCFAFFVNVEILFSVWFFQLLGILETGFLNRLGVISPATTIVPGGLVSIQFSGGLIMFVLWGFWMARGHLAMVYRHAIGKPTELNDEDELFSYRTALLGLCGGLIYLIMWLHAIGLTLPIAILFLTLLFIFYLGIARVLAEAGLINLDLPINAHAFTIGIVGSANMTGSTLTGLGLTNAFARNWRTFTMVALSHIAWFREYMWPNRQRLALWISLAFVLSVLTSTSYVIYTGYDQGADNLHINLTNTGILFHDLIVKWMRNATRISEIEILFLISGAVVNMVLVAGRLLFHWWPLNPIGFVIGASGPIRGLTFTIFVAWLIKVILMRLGGVGLYKRMQPLFLGILVGFVAGVAVSYVVDSVWFPDTPHIGEIF